MDMGQKAAGGGSGALFKFASTAPITAVIRENGMQAMEITGATTTSTATSAATPPQRSASVPNNAAAGVDSKLAGNAPAPATRVTLSAAAQAYLSQPDPPTAAEVRRNKKPKMKTLVELMLEWSKKYEDQQRLREKDKPPVSPLAAAQSEGATPS